MTNHHLTKHIINILRISQELCASYQQSLQVLIQHVAQRCLVTSRNTGYAQQGVVTSISPIEPGSKWNQAIKASVCSESNDQESLKLGDQAPYKSNL